MDARERLRLYLEQRRELGETEFVLDSLPVDDVLRLLGDRQAAAPTARSDRAPVAAANWREVLAPEAQTPRAAPTVDTAATGIVVGASIGESAPGALGQLATLDAIAQHVAKCTGCSLYKTAKQHVPGEGNPHAGFVCVGEAPGEKEDELGRPFVGRAGDLLTKILDAIQLKREDVFICNVLKHRPPGNRNPTPDEIRACSPYLLRQLELLRPRVILALGTFAAQTLLQTSQPIGKLRGIVHRYYGVPLIVTYHPAALLRNSAWKRPTWEDVQLARRIFDSSAQG